MEQKLFLIADRQSEQAADELINYLAGVWVATSESLSDGENIPPPTIEKLIVDTRGSTHITICQIVGGITFHDWEVLIFLDPSGNREMEKCGQHFFNQNLKYPIAYVHGPRRPKLTFQDHQGKKIRDTGPYRNAVAILDTTYIHKVHANMTSA